MLNYEFNEARPTIGQTDEDEKSEQILIYKPTKNDLIHFGWLFFD